MWAVSQHPQGVRAGPGSGLAAWDAADLEQLREEGSAFRRVGGPALPDPGRFLREVTAGLFGAGLDEVGGRLALRPWVVSEWRTMALRRLRLHRTIVDVEVRPRAEWVTVRLEVEFGPAAPCLLALRNSGRISRLTVDEVPLEGERAIFSLSGQHEIVFFLLGRSP